MTTTPAPLAGTAAIETPVGTLAVVVGDDGTVVASGFGDVRTLLRRLGVPADAAANVAEADQVLVEPVADAVRRYFEGDVAALDDVRVDQPGGPFSQRAWDVLRAVTPGEPVTYAELAERAGSSGASRAAGQACARNLVAPFVPCHRVVPAGGGVGGYAYGADVKERLLAHERTHARAT